MFNKPDEKMSIQEARSVLGLYLKEHQAVARLAGVLDVALDVEKVIKDAQSRQKGAMDAAAQAEVESVKKQADLLEQHRQRIEGLNQEIDGITARMGNLRLDGEAKAKEYAARLRKFQDDIAASHAQALAARASHDREVAALSNEHKALIAQYTAEETDAMARVVTARRLLTNISATIDSAVR